MWRQAHELIEKHTAALAEDLMALFQGEVLQPYRDRGRPAEERSRLAAALTQLKPLTVRGVVTAFGRAVNRTIRERMACRITGGDPRTRAALWRAVHLPPRVRANAADNAGGRS